MTLVTVALTRPTQDGALVPATGVLRFTPTRRRVLDGAVVLPVPFVAQLVLGTAEVDLAPNDTSWVWRVDEHVTGAPSRTIYANVPDTVAIAYTALEPLDPDTLEPEAALSPAWVASQNLVLARDPAALFVGTVTYMNGAPTSASVAWPDGVTGTYTGTPSTAFPGSVDAYTITHGTTTYTQPAVTRDAAGNITNQPAIEETTA